MFKLSIFKNEDNSEQLREKFHGADSLPLKVSIKAGWRMIKLYWGSKDSLFAWFLLVCIIGLTGGAIYLAKVINTWYKESHSFGALTKYVSGISHPSFTYFSPVFGNIEPAEIVEYMIANKLNDVRLQIQMHKVIWDPNKRGV